MTNLEYIQSTGTQYIDTGITPGSSLQINITFETSGTTAYHAVLGSRTGSNKCYLLNADGSSGTDYSTKEFGVGATIIKPSPSISTHNIRTDLVWMGGSVTFTNSQGTYSTNVGTIPNGGLNIFLCAFNDDGSPARIGDTKIYSCKIYTGGTLVRDFIPVKDENNVACLYDDVSHTYFYNAGTGDFVEGPVLTITKYLIESEGNYYSIISNVLTNVGSTLNAQLFADYGMDTAPSWSGYSSLSNPSVLLWNTDSEISMTATTTGVPNPNAVVSQTLMTGSGVREVAIISDNSTLYSVSFDGGSTWWKHSGGSWSQVSSITDGMTKAEVEAISSGAWGIKNTGQMKIRFTLLDENGYVTSITEDYGFTDGHIIEDGTGTEMTQRDGLQFIGATVTDDSANNRTVVTVPSDASEISYGSGTVEDALDASVNIQTLNPSYSVPVDGDITAYKMGKFVLVTGYFQPNGADISVDAEIASVPGINVLGNYYCSIVTTNQLLGRIKFKSGNKIVNENIPLLQSNYYSFTFMMIDN